MMYGWFTFTGFVHPHVGIWTTVLSLRWLGPPSNFIRYVNIDESREQSDCRQIRGAIHRGRRVKVAAVRWLNTRHPIMCLLHPKTHYMTHKRKVLVKPRISIPADKPLGWSTRYTKYMWYPRGRRSPWQRYWPWIKSKLNRLKKTISQWNLKFLKVRLKVTRKGVDDDCMPSIAMTKS